METAGDTLDLTYLGPGEIKVVIYRQTDINYRAQIRPYLRPRGRGSLER